MQVFKVLTAHVRFHTVCECFAAESHVETVRVRLDALEILSVDEMQQEVEVKFQHSELGVAENKKGNLEWEVFFDRLFRALDFVQVVCDDVGPVENTRVDEFRYFGSVAVANVTVFFFVGQTPAVRRISMKRLCLAQNGLRGSLSPARRASDTLRQNFSKHFDG